MCGNGGWHETSTSTQLEKRPQRWGGKGGGNCKAMQKKGQEGQGWVHSHDGRGPNLQ